MKCCGACEKDVAHVIDFLQRVKKYQNKLDKNTYRARSAPTSDIAEKLKRSSTVNLGGITIKRVELNNSQEDDPLNYSTSLVGNAVFCFIYEICF